MMTSIIPDGEPDKKPWGHCSWWIGLVKTLLSINQSVNQSPNQPTNQSINQSEPDKSRSHPTAVATGYFPQGVGFFKVH